MGSFLSSSHPYLTESNLKMYYKTFLDKHTVKDMDSFITAPVMVAAYRQKAAFRSHV